MNRKWEKQNTWQINEKKKIEKNSLNEWEKNHISMKMMKKENSQNLRLKTRFLYVKRHDYAHTHI